jgi:hypothetical protein
VTVERRSRWLTAGTTNPGLLRPTAHPAALLTVPRAVRGRQGWAALVRRVTLTGVLVMLIAGLMGPASAASTKPLQLKDLLTAPVPAACRHPAGRLRNGSLPGLGASEGFVTVNITGKDTVRPALGDVTGDRVPDAVAVLHCSAGGVDWPHMILLYERGPRLITYLDLATVTPGEHSTVTALRITRGDILLAWRSYEGCCSNMKSWSATLHWNRSKLQVQHLRQIAGVAANATPAATTSVVLQPGGGIRGLSTTRATSAILWLTQRLGKPTSQTSPMCDPSGTPGRVISWGDFAILVSAAKGKSGALPPNTMVGWTYRYVAHPTGRPLLHTSTGIGAGTTRAHVKAAYPRAIAQATGGGTRLVVGGTNRTTRLTFDFITADTVSSIASGYDCGE